MSDSYELYECQNCGATREHKDLLPAKDILQRQTQGEPFSDVECPDCGALCYEIESGPKPVVDRGTQ